MLWNRSLGLVLAISSFVSIPLSARGQEESRALKKIELPVAMFRGIWWSAMLRSKWLFSSQMTPSHELLVYEPNKNGKWPLVRVGRWWTNNAEVTVLSTPGWSSKDAKNLQGLDTDLQITPNGQYAVAFAAADWHGPTDIPGRKQNTIINIVDLSRFRAVASLDTLALGLGSVDRGQILDNAHLLLVGSRWEAAQSTTTYSVVSIPTLASVSRCETNVPHLTPSEMKKVEQDVRKRNDAACEDLLRLSGTVSVAEIEALGATGRRPPPEPLNDPNHLGNTKFESSSGDWYEVDSIHSELSVWNNKGELLRKRRSPNLLCEGQPIVGPAWICDCEPVGLLESQDVLLTYCITKHDNFFGSQVWLKQWFSIFRSDDLSGEGLIRLSNKNEETKATIDAVDGRAYVLTVSLGDTVRVYEVPAHGS